MEHAEKMIQGHDGLRLYTQRNEIDDPKGAVIILHGYCEHSNRYGHVVEYLNDQGYNCYLIDHRGHGQSEGQRAAILQFEEYLADIDIFMRVVREYYPDGPLFMLGHSMGGLILSQYVLTREPEIAGVILSSPYLGLKAEVPAWKAFAGKLMSRLMPSLSLASELDPHLISHDETVVQDYISDESVSKIANARWFTESTAAQNFCLDHAHRWKLPALIMHGGDDRIADPDTTKRFAEKIGDADIEFVALDHLYHEIYNEVDRASVLDRTGKWLLSRLEAK